MHNSYCLIRLISSRFLSLFLFKKINDSGYPICLFASSSNSIYQLIAIHDVYQGISIDHCLYLGRELYKAELTAELGQLYVQR